jgi:hypothetical protein
LNALQPALQDPTLNFPSAPVLESSPNSFPTSDSLADTPWWRKAAAIKNWEIALRNIPESRKAQQPVYENALKKLKEGV